MRIAESGAAGKRLSLFDGNLRAEGRRHGLLAACRAPSKLDDPPITDSSSVIVACRRYGHHEPT